MSRPSCSFPKLRTWFLALGVLLTALPAVGAQESAFQPLVWAYASDRQPDLMRRLREIGFLGVNVGGGEDPGFARAAGLQFYVDPALPKGSLHIRRDTLP